jgi:rod shape determining protein RodA
MFQGFSIRKYDFLLVILVTSLSIFGVVAVTSADPGLTARQIYGLAIGLVVMLVVSVVDYRKVLRLYWAAYAACIFLLVLVWRFGVSGGGARRWINIAGLTFQPSEAGKILLILFFAKFIMEYRDRWSSVFLFPVCCVLVLLPVGLIVVEPDLSTSLMVMIIFCVLMFVGVLSYQFVAGVLAVLIPVTGLFFFMVLNGMVLSGYQQQRILAWLHPENYATTTAYQTMQSITAIGSGGLLGKGSLESSVSLLETGFISESQTDFIFTVIGEEFGFVGTCTIVLLVAAIAVRCFQIAQKADDLAGRLIASGMGAWIGFQGFMNIGVATGLLPNTGIPLPFVSYGLTSLVSLFAGIGFTINVRMQSRSAGIMLPIGGSADEKEAEADE